LISFAEQTRYHNEFQKEGIYYLQQRGYTIADGTYHNKFPPEFQKILKNMNNDITSLYIKGWPDNYIAQDDFVALIEWKTQESKRDVWPGKTIPNASIEATQYAFHYKLAELGIVVIYAYRDTFYGVEKGFVLEKGKPFDVVNRRVRFPIKADNNQETKEKQARFLEDVFGDELQINPKPSGNHVSPDPYFLILSEKLEQLKNWEEVLP